MCFLVRNFLVCCFAEGWCQRCIGIQSYPSWGWHGVMVPGVIGGSALSHLVIFLMVQLVASSFFVSVMKALVRVRSCCKGVDWEVPHSCRQCFVAALIRCMWRSCCVSDSPLMLGFMGSICFACASCTFAPSCRGGTLAAQWLGVVVL